MWTRSPMSALAVRVAGKRKVTGVIDRLLSLFILWGRSNNIRSDNEPEFVSQAVRDWIGTVGARAAYI